MKKGFTLVELLAVLVILGLIGLIAIPTVTSILNKSKTNLCQTEENNIKEATRTWMADHISLTPTGNSNICKYSNLSSDECTDINGYSSLEITLLELQNNNYIDKEIKNPKTKQKIDSTTTITISSSSASNKLDYEVNLDC